MADDNHPGYAECRAAFRQTYDPTLACVYRNGECTADVAEYYFSDGGTLPLCTFHLKEASVVCDDGIPISKQYNAEVYEKSFPG